MRYYKAESDGFVATRSTENGRYKWACPRYGTFSSSPVGADRAAARARQYYRLRGSEAPHAGIVRVTEIDAAEYRRINKARRSQ